MSRRSHHDCCAVLKHETVRIVPELLCLSQAEIAKKTPQSRGLVGWMDEPLDQDCPPPPAAIPDQTAKIPIDKLYLDVTSSSRALRILE